MNTINIPSFLQTDFYQISMVYAYVMNDIANDITGFEGFYRHVKPEINAKADYYIFSGEQDVVDYITKIKEEFASGVVVDGLCFLMKGRVPDKSLDIFREKAKNLIYDFEFSVAPEGSILFPLLPAFQFEGPRWVGQIMETQTTNCYNGKSGFSTLSYLKKNGLSDVSSIDLAYIEAIVFNIGGGFQERYVADLRYRAEEFKEAAGDKGILEAAFRRAPSRSIAQIASQIALNAGWSGTSNTSIWNDFNSKFIGGTMAHAFVMSFENELDAFVAWQNTMGPSTILVDTYDTFNAIQLLIDNDIKPLSIRLDSGDFFIDVPRARAMLDGNRWNDVSIFISGDITPEDLNKLEAFSIPYDKAMAGTKYVYNNSIIKRANCGFVYKIVQFEKDGVLHFPLKKAEGKKNYPGLKEIKVQDGFATVGVISKKLTRRNLDVYKKITPDTQVSFFECNS